MSLCAGGASSAHANVAGAQAGLLMCSGVAFVDLDGGEAHVVCAGALASSCREHVVLAKTRPKELGLRSRLASSCGYI